MNQLPPETLEQILGFVDEPDYLSLRTVCRSWHSVATPAAFRRIIFNDSSTSYRRAELERGHFPLQKLAKHVTIRFGDLENPYASSNEIRKLLKELRSWADLEIVDLMFALHLGDDATRQDARHQYWIVRQAFARLIRDFIREDPVEDSYRINVFEEGQRETFCLSSKGEDCSMRLCIPPTGDQNTLEIMQKALPPMMLSEGNISLTSLHLENMVVDRNSFTLLKKPRINHVILRKVYLLKPVYGPRLAWAKIWRDTVPYVWPHLRTLCVEACAYSAVMLGTDQILYEASLVSEDDLEQDTLELDRLKARLAQRSLSESQ